MCRDGGACRGEEMGILQAQLLAYQREDGLVEQLVLQMQRQGRLLAGGQVFYVMTAAYLLRMAEQLTLHATAGLDLLLHTLIYLLPETGYTRHTSGMLLAHRLLNLLRIGVHNQSGTNGDAQQGPATLKDMCEGQEVHHAVVLVHRHILMVGLHSRMELSHAQNNALRVACGTASIQDISDVVHRGGSLTAVELLLTCQALTQLQECRERHHRGIILGNLHGRVEHNDTLQRLACGEHTMCLVELLLLAHEEKTYLGVVDHKLYLLLAAGGIERYCNSTNTPGAEVNKQILYRVLREDTYVLLFTNTQRQQGVGHLTGYARELVP